MSIPPPPPLTGQPMETEHALRELAEAKEALNKLEALKTEQKKHITDNLKQKFQNANARIITKATNAKATKKSQHAQRTAAKLQNQHTSKTKRIEIRRRQREERRLQKKIKVKHVDPIEGHDLFLLRPGAKQIGDIKPNYTSPHARKNSIIRIQLQNQIHATLPRLNKKRASPPPPPFSNKFHNKTTVKKKKHRDWSKTKALKDIWYAVSVNAPYSILKEHSKSKFSHVNHVNETLCHVAVKSNHYECLKNILKVAGTDFSSLLIHTKDAEGDTPLHAAVRNNSVQCLEILIEHGALVDVVNKSGLSPLHIAIQLNQCRCVDIILKTATLQKVGRKVTTALDVWKRSPIEMIQKENDCILNLWYDHVDLVSGIVELEEVEIENAKLRKMKIEKWKKVTEGEEEAVRLGLNVMDVEQNID